MRQDRAFVEIHQHLKVENSTNSVGHFYFAEVDRVMEFQ